MRQYWETRVARVGGPDAERDPDALQNVCHGGAPGWFNQYYARGQRRAYRALFDLIPLAPGARALDVGCGAGRWCRLLSRRGLATTGIDLQCDLIEADRARYPDIQFACTAIQDYAPAEPFDLVSSVTVIQHVPADEQAAVARKLRDLVKDGGYVLMLENVREQRAHVFARSIEDWTRLFEQYGFQLIAARRYDYNPCTRIYRSARRAVGRLVRRARGAVAREGSPEDAHATDGTQPARPDSRTFAVLEVTLAIDRFIDPILFRNNLPLSTVHCGFLFRATGAPAR